MIRNFVNLADFSGEQLQALLDRAIAEKTLFAAGEGPAPLHRKVLAMIFEKPSLRTRVSFAAAMTHLGGQSIYLTQADIGLGQRESVADTARVLGKMVDGIVARTFSHEAVEQLAELAPVPVVNALTDWSHPCQAMADLMTVQERLGSLAGRKLVFVGDGNNVARSLAIGCGKLGMHFTLAAPMDYQLDEAFLSTLQPDRFDVTDQPRQAVADADVVYTDTWVSMGQEEEKSRRLADFEGFQVNAELMANAPDHAIVLHCLPAYKGVEITEETFEAHADAIFDEAGNRLHFQRALLHVLLAGGGIA